jgi:hypothetical protein
VIASFARLHGVLDLAWTAESDALYLSVERAKPIDEVVLEELEELVYLHRTERWRVMWGPDIDLLAPG